MMDHFAANVVRTIIRMSQDEVSKVIIGDGALHHPQMATAEAEIE